MNFTQSSISKLYRKYLIPSLASAAALSVFGLVDMWAIGQGVGADGIAAFSIITPLYGVTSFFGVFLGIGGAVPMAIAKGEKNEEKSNAFFTSSLILIILFTLLLWMGFFLFSTEIYTFFGATEKLMPYVNGYGSWFIRCLPVFFFVIYFACIIRCDGAPGLTMFAVIFSGLFNVFGDWLLVFVCDMGMAGAAIATVAGNAIQVIIYIGYFFTKKCGLRLVKPHHMAKAFRKILAAGFSTGFIDIAFILLTILLNNLVLQYGDETALAVFGVAFTCTSTAQKLYCGVGQAIQPIVSANYGAGRPGRILETLRLSMITEGIIGLIAMSLGVVFPISVAKLFIETSPEILDITPSVIRPFFLSLLVMGVNMLATYYFQSIMRSALATVIALLRGILLSGLFVIVFPVWFGLAGIWWGMVLTEIAVFIITAVCLLRTGRKLYS